MTDSYRRDNTKSTIEEQEKSVNDFEIPAEFLSNLSDFITRNDIKLINKKMDIYDTVNMFLENNQSEDPFFIVNLGDIVRQYQKWITHLPNIKPFYAVKCNPDVLILKLLATLGCNFDCASKNEIAKVLDLGVSPNRIVFANPCKMGSMIKYSQTRDISLTTVDSEYELYKIKLYHPDVGLLLRIKTDDKHSLCKFSCKFGLELDEVEGILKIAKNLDLNIVGVCFHVGSGCLDPETYTKSIADSRKVFDMATNYGFDMKILDIGGGFSAVDNEKLKFKDVAETINSALNTYFGNYENLQVIAEPGRFFVGSSHTLVLTVINKKVRIDKETKEKEVTLYINDGVYSSMNNVIMDHFKIDENNLIPFINKEGKKYNTKIFGPTCDSIDLITNGVKMEELNIGAHLLAINYGAYTSATTFGSEVFNGFNKTSAKYIMS